MKLYKVLVDGKSCHGGNLEWSLPKVSRGKVKPGEWHEVPRIVPCVEGLHLTRAPLEWAEPDCQVFEVEVPDDAIRSNYSNLNEKCVVSKCRLVRQLSGQELCDLGIVTDGFSRDVMAGETVVVYGGTIQRVQGGTIQYVYDGTIRYVYDGTIQAVHGGTIQYVYDGTIQRVQGGTIQAVHGGTIQYVYDGTIQAVHGGTIQYVYDGTIQAVQGGATVVVHFGNLPESVKGNAVVIDRRGGKPVVIMGEGN